MPCMAAIASAGQCRQAPRSAAVGADACVLLNRASWPHRQPALKEPTAVRTLNSAAAAIVDQHAAAKTVAAYSAAAPRRGRSSADGLCLSSAGWQCDDRHDNCPCTVGDMKVRAAAISRAIRPPRRRERQLECKRRSQAADVSAASMRAALCVLHGSCCTPQAVRCMLHARADDRADQLGRRVQAVGRASEGAARCILRTRALISARTSARARAPTQSARTPLFPFHTHMRTHARYREVRSDWLQLQQAVLLQTLPPQSAPLLSSSLRSPAPRPLPLRSL